jgi:hypothetical protein
LNLERIADVLGLASVLFLGHLWMYANLCILIKFSLSLLMFAICFMNLWSLVQLEKEEIEQS